MIVCFILRVIYQQRNKNDSDRFQTRRQNSACPTSHPSPSPAPPASLTSHSSPSPALPTCPTSHSSPSPAPPASLTSHPSPSPAPPTCPTSHPSPSPALPTCPTSHSSPSPAPPASLTSHPSPSPAPPTCPTSHPSPSPAPPASLTSAANTQYSLRKQHFLQKRHSTRLVPNNTQDSSNCQGNINTHCSTNATGNEGFMTISTQPIQREIMNKATNRKKNPVFVDDHGIITHTRKRRKQ